MSTFRRLPAVPEIEGFDTREHAVLAHATARLAAAQADAEDAAIRLRMAAMAVKRAETAIGTHWSTRACTRLHPDV